jgi:uncharacterized YigZ family protein
MTKTNERDFYFTIAGAIRAPEVKISASRFIADLIPISSKEDIESALDRIRKEFYDASHHCYAYRIGNHAEIIRAADDGEPAGTAGKPILLVLEGADITNVLCVVTRYFGGTKLGTGGLARAYSEAAQLAVSLSAKTQVFLRQPVSLTCNYDELAALERYLIHHNLKAYDAIYGDSISMVVDVRLSEIEQLQAEIQEKFLGKVITTKL